MHRPLKLLGLACALAGLGCTGTIETGAEGPNGDNGTGAGGSGTGGSGTGGAGGAGGDMRPVDPMKGALNDKATVPGSNPLRRLTLLEYKNTVRDLLGLDAEQVSLAGLAADSEAGLSGFARGSGLTTGNDARALMTSADKAAQTIQGNLGKVLPCNPVPTAAGEQDTCIDKFISGFGLRVFRRPVVPAEATALKNLYKAQRDAAVGATFEQAVLTMVSTMLQSPAFLYHWELGPNAPTKDAGNVIRFNPYEMASRLSYLLWKSMPDEKLFVAAGAGGLTSPEQIAAEAQRMVGDNKAKDAIADFHFQWLEIGGLIDMPKDPEYKDYSPAVAQAMQDETRQFVSSVFFGPTPDLKTLFTSTKSFANAALGKLYGTTVSGNGMQEVNLDPKQRSGLLTQGSFLAVKADAGESLPPKRGDALLHRALCIDLEVPPNLVVPAVADPNPMQTTRERFDVHGKDACAAACHTFIDPIGFAFENYDAVGAYRTMENGKPIDASGQIELPLSKTVKFNNAIELSRFLADAPETQDCMVRQWMRYSLGRREFETEEPSFKVLQELFKGSKGDLRELIVGLTKTRAFTHRVLSVGEVAQ